MIFSPEQIQQLFNIIDYRMARVVADVLGKEFLTPDDKALLLRNGFDIEKELKKIPPYWQAFLFGRLASLLTDNQLKTLDYTDIQQYVERKQYKEPSRREMAEYRAAATRTYSYIKGMGNRVRETLTSSLSEQEIKNAVEERRIEDLSVLKREIELGVIEKRSIQGIVSNLGHQLQDWNRDWGRIVETEMQDIFQIGKAQTIMEEHGIDARVYKHTFSGACKYCIKLYTTEGIGSKPREFKLSSLIANGNNIGVKVKDWKATLGPVHPFCRCELHYIPDGYIWSEENQSYEPPKNYQRKIERKSKVTIIVGEKIFEI